MDSLVEKGKEEAMRNPGSCFLTKCLEPLPRPQGFPLSKDP